MADNNYIDKFKNFAGKFMDSNKFEEMYKKTNNSDRFIEKEKLREILLKN